MRRTHTMTLLKRQPLRQGDPLVLDHTTGADEVGTVNTLGQYTALPDAQCWT